MNNYDNIPLELRALNQWVVWKDNKVPYDCITNNMANVNDVNTWHSFVDATNAINSGYSGIGFVFSHTDDYTFIDLDHTDDQVAQKRQIEIYHEFDSYSEVSPSGKGLHIIIRGSVPAGRRRSHIEIYSSQRYATFTGNSYPPNQPPKPIADRQQQLLSLWHQMGDGPVAHTMYQDQPEKYSDDEVIKRASSAANRDKFQQLFTGQWTANYPSQSEADLALINMVAFYTQNRTQIGRIFRLSALGKRDKANRQEYLAWMINKSFDQTLPPIDFDGFKNQLELKLAINHAKDPIDRAIQEQAPIPLQAPQQEYQPQSTVQIPPGLLGELAQFIYAAAPRPVPEIALAGAIGLMAGIAGRAYNISGTGLNQYILLLADTGTGKEAMASGIDKIMNSIRLSVPTSTGYVGPSEIASGQALIKHINKFSQCFVSILGEFGLRLQSMSSQHASSAEIGLRRILLDLYNKSGHGQVWRGSIYADRDKNVEATRSPSFTILGESTPERFYGALNEEMISEGLLPRFMIIEYLGARPGLNKNCDIAVPFKLHDQFSSLVAQCESVTHRNEVVNVQCDPASQRMLDEFDEYATSLINKSDKDIIRQLWNRAHIKALKLSALVAIGVNFLVPTITSEYVEWAIGIVRSDISALSKKFEAGLIGASSSEIKQMNEFIKRIREYFLREWDEVKSYCPSCGDLHHNKIIPYEYFNTRISTLAAFKNDKMGATNAMKRTLQTLIDSGKIEEITKTKHYADKFNRGSKRAFIAKAELFE